ncbi:MAG: hypothetical protein HFE81_06210 [Bacilli bacterium]|nr:hypothetical protein [Bacilli bacterium]
MSWMREIETAKLPEITGGTTITATVINAIVNVIKVIKETGYSLGSGIRRISENNICPLD